MSFGNKNINYDAVAAARKAQLTKHGRERVKNTRVACGCYHTVLTCSNGKAYSFGAGGFGKLGHGTEDHEWVPRVVENLDDNRIVEVALSLVDPHPNAPDPDPRWRLSRSTPSWSPTRVPSTPVATATPAGSAMVMKTMSRYRDGLRV